MQVGAGAALAEDPKATIKDPHSKKRLKRGLDWIGMDEAGKQEKTLKRSCPSFRKDRSGRLILFVFVGFDKKGLAFDRIPAGIH